MATSYNGWPVLSSSHPVRFEAGGRSWYAANRDVATIFAYLIDRFDREVEPVDAGQLDDWSYAVRAVRGQEASSTSMSCHASATAIDINALKHPRYARGTFTSEKTAAVRRILGVINQDGLIVRWGNDYISAPVDAMHFEINAGERSVKQAADKIRRAVEDDVTPDDLKKIKAMIPTADDVADEIMQRLTGSRAVRNIPTNPDGPRDLSSWTITGALAAGDKKADLALAEIRDLAAKVDKIIDAPDRT